MFGTLIKVHSYDLLAYLIEINNNFLPFSITSGFCDPLLFALIFRYDALVSADQ